VINYGSGMPAPWLKKKEERAIRTINKWLELTDSKVYCSVSGGKDSLVAADLICRVFPDCPLVWVNQGHLAEWDDCIELLYFWKEQGRNLVELCPPLGLIQLFRKYGMSFDGRFTALDKKHCKELLLKPLEEYQEMNNIQGYAWGLRKESKGRSLFIRSRGELTQLKNGLFLCTPVGFWTTQDIWSYIDNYKLPYAAIYDTEGRDKFRNGPPIDTALANWGKLSVLRYRHPHIWNQITDLFPEYANHV
jgi:3'-phosphoadenosine 5'-phosphosulfate sulfotransferase (PAPS reductase)/FAD synthetase